MLVLSRSEGQGIRIGDVHVTVHKARNGKVQVGIKAPRNVPILRDELVKEKDDERDQDDPA